MSQPPSAMPPDEADNDKVRGTQGAPSRQDLLALVEQIVLGLDREQPDQTPKDRALRYAAKAGELVRKEGATQAAAELLVRAAELLDRERLTEEQAFAYYVQALSLDPRHPSAFLGLARICGQRRHWRKLPPDYQRYLEQLLTEKEHWEDLLRIYQGRVEVTEDTQEVAQTYLRIGDILDQKQNQPLRALNAYKMAQALYPNDVRAFEAIWQILSRQQRWQELHDHLEGQLEFVSDAERRVSLLLELAVLSERQLRDDQRAGQYYEQVLDANPQTLAAYEALERILRRNADFTGLRALFERQRTAIQEPRLLARSYEQLGALELYTFGNLARAQDYFEASLRILPTQPSALRGLDLIYTKRRNYERLIPVLKARSVQGQTVEEKSRAFSRLGRLYWEVFQDTQQAEAFLRRYLEVTDRKDLALHLLDRLYRQSGNFEGRVEVFRLRAQRTADSGKREEILMELAQLLENESGARENAEKVYQEISQLSPGPSLARGSLKRMYREQERWQELYDICRLEIEETEDETIRIQNFLTLAELDEYQFGRLEEASGFYREVLDLNPRTLSALKGLERIYVKLKAWAPLIELYRQSLEYAQDLKEEAYLYFRMAEVTEELARQLEPGAEEMETASEEIIRLAEAALLRDPQMRPALKLLIVHYERLGNEEASYRVRRLYVETLTDPIEKAEQIYQCGEISQKMGREADAVALWEDAAVLDPGHLGVLRHLASHYYQSESWEIAASAHEALEAALRQGRVPPRFDLAVFYFRLGQIYRKLERFGDAVVALSQAKTLNPGLVPARRELADLYFIEQKWALLREELRSIVDAVEKEDRVDVLLKLGTAESAMENWGDAEQRFQEVLRIDPLNEVANSALINILQRQERHDDLARLYRERLESLEDPELGLREGLRLAQLQLTVLQNPKEALRMLRRLQVDHPENAEVYQVFGKALRDQHQDEEWLSLVRKRLTTVESEDERRSVRLDLAQALETQRTGWEESEEIYRELLDEEPGHAEALRGLGRVLLKRKNWSELVEVYEMEQRYCTSDEDSAVISFKIGEIQVAQLKREDDAVRSYKDAFTKDPGLVPAVRALRRIYERRKDFEKVPPLIAREIELAQSRAEEARLHYELGRIFEEQLERPDRGVKHYEDALRIAPGFGPAARRLAVQAYQRGDWPVAEKYYDILSVEFRRVPAKARPDRISAGFFYKYGKIAEHLKKDQKAIDCYRRSLEFQPAFYPALSALAELCLRREWWDEARLCMEQIIRLPVETDPTEQIEWQFRLAELEERQGNLELAMARYKEVLRLNGKHEGALKSLIRRYRSEQKWRVVVGLTHRLAELFEERSAFADVFDVCWEESRIWIEELSDPARSMETIRKALQIAPSPEHRLRALELAVPVWIKEEAWDEIRNHVATAVADSRLTHSLAVRLEFALAQAYWHGERLESAAREALGRLLVQEPGHVGALTLLGQILRDSGDVSSLIENLQQRLELVTEAGARSQLLEERGDLQLERGDERQALQSFRAATEVNPQATGARKKLVQLYRGNDAFYRDATRELHILMDQDPLSTEAYHDLIPIYEARGEIERLRTLCEVLQLLGDANEREQSVLRRLPPHRLWPNGTLPESYWESVFLDPDAESILQIIWNEVGESLTALFASGSPGERMKNPPEWLQRLAITMGIEDFQVFVTRERSLAIRVIPAAKPTVQLTYGVLERLGEESRRFLGARAWAACRFQLGVLGSLPEDQVRRLFLLMARLVDSDLELEGYEEAGMKEDLRRLKRAIPRKQRAQMEEPMQRFIEQLQGEGPASLDFDRWINGLWASSNRVGLLFAQDVRAALDCLRQDRTEGDPIDLTKPAHVRQLLQSDGQALKLLRFAVSLAHFELRDRLGLSRSSLVADNPRLR